jgi:hypothetical protein
MFSLQTIEAFVSTDSIKKQVFSSIVTSESKATKDMSIEIAENLAKTIFLENFPVNQLSGKYILQISEKMSIDDFMIFCLAKDSEADKNILKNAFEKLMLSSLLRPLSTRFMCWMFDLDFDAVRTLRSENEDAYLEIGDAIVLAGAYLGLQSK